MIGEMLIVLEAAVAQPPLPEAAPGPFGVAALPDDVLAEQRGGIRLPNGIDVALSIDTVTALDGNVVLQTVTRIAEGAPVVTAYAPAEGEPIALPTNGQPAPGAAPSVTYDPRTGVTVTASVPMVQLKLTSENRNGAPAVIPGLQAVDLGEPASTPNGAVHTVRNGGMAGVELHGADFSIMHLTGSALGATILNTGNDRAIDTRTTLSIDLRNAGPDVLGSAMLRVEDIGVLALGSRL